MCMGCSWSLTHTQTGHELIMDSIGSSWISFLISLLLPTNLYAQGTSNPLPSFLLPVTSHVTLHPWQRKYQNTLESSLGTCPTAQLSFIKHTACLSWVLLSSRCPQITLWCVCSSRSSWLSAIQCRFELTRTGVPTLIHWIRHNTYKYNKTVC